VPSPEPSGRVPLGTGRDSGKRPAIAPAKNNEEKTLLVSLEDMGSSGKGPLDATLAAIADAARSLTGASGAAIAMWKDGVMVCRARSGETAPPLGAQLNANAGISGECLRTGTAQHCPDTESNALVDAEVCRSLGLRSIAVLPIRGRRRVNGILEVFGTMPGAFAEHQIALLEELAALAERARAAQAHGASQASANKARENTERLGLLPASARLSSGVLAVVGGRSRRFALGTIGVAAVVLIALAIWLGWRGTGQNARKARAVSPALVAAPPSQHQLSDNDPVWKPNPGGETLYASNGKRPIGSSVKFAAKADAIKAAIGGEKPNGGPSLATAGASGVAPSGAGEKPGAADTNLTASSPAEDNSSSEAPAIANEQPDASQLNGVFPAAASLPELSFPISKGVSGGRPVHKVPPVYPPQAMTQRLQGRVVLSAIVGEDGSIGDVKVVEGAPALAEAAVVAVKSWRYQPFLLNGKPIERETKIIFDFKLP
jgi:TonB family protein